MLFSFVPCRAVEKGESKMLGEAVEPGEATVLKR